MGSPGPIRGGEPPMMDGSRRARFRPKSRPSWLSPRIDRSRGSPASAAVSTAWSTSPRRRRRPGRPVALVGARRGAQPRGRARHAAPVRRLVLEGAPDPARELAAPAGSSAGRSRASPRGRLGWREDLGRSGAVDLGVAHADRLRVGAGRTRSDPSGDRRRTPPGTLHHGRDRTGPRVPALVRAGVEARR